MKKTVGVIMCVLVLAAAFLPVVGSTKETGDENGGGHSPVPTQLLWMLLNLDWNYWDARPDMYTIPTGNVGIGTPTPGSKLEVAGMIHSSVGGFKFPDGTVQTTAVTGGGDDDWEWSSGSGLSGDIYHLGDVGIGTTNPSSELEIYGDTNDFVGIKINNPHTGSNSAEGIYFNNEDGGIAGIRLFDEGSGPYPSYMNIFNNRPGGSIHLISGSVHTPDLYVSGKGTFTGGVDPPYISFSEETHESIREYAREVTVHEKVMQFWNGDAHRMEVYVINEDAFYTITGEKIVG